MLAIKSLGRAAAMELIYKGAKIALVSWKRDNLISAKNHIIEGADVDVLSIPVSSGPSGIEDRYILSNGRRRQICLRGVPTTIRHVRRQDLPHR